METGYIDEHQPVDDQSEESSNYTPTDEEKRTLAVVYKHYHKNKAYREKYDHKWLDYYKMFRGKQWKEQRPSYRHSAVINMVFKVIQSHIPIQTDSFPKIEFLPQEPNDRELAGILTELAESDWDRQNWILELIDNLYDANIYGIAYGGMEWDADASDGLGEICFETKDPFYQFPDPNARKINDRRQRTYIEAEPIDVEMLKEEYPDKKKFIKPDLIDVMEGDKTDLRDIRYRSPVDAKTIVEGSRHTEEMQNNKALKITLWIDDRTVVEEKQTIMEKGSEGQEVPKVEYIQKRQHPRLRKICVVGNVVLSDDYVEYDDNQVPRARMVNYTLPREFYGISEVEQVESLQVTYNKIVSFALDVMTLMGNPIWVVSQDAGIDTDNLINRPGLIIEPQNPGARVERQQGVALQPGVLQVLDIIGAQFDEIMGANDTTKGLRPEGVASGRAIEAVQEIGQQRLRQKAKFMDAYLRDLGHMYLSRVFQFYSSPRVARLTNNPDAEKYFKLHVEMVQDKMTGEPVREVVYQGLNPDGTLAKTKRFRMVGRFDVKASTGSSLPFSKAERTNTALSMFDRGIFDEEEVLTAHDYPNKEALLERIRQRKEAEAQMAMAQQAGAPSAG